jgi:DNA-binding transcriptional MerR regulator
MQQMVNSLNSIEQLRDAEFHGVRELAEAAKAYLSSTKTSPQKSTATEFPNERTVRYYITEGLLDQAIKRKGVTSVFGYEHLLTLLVIKKLQADGVPIKVIKDLIANKPFDELEKLLGEEVKVFTNRPELDAYRTSIGHTDDSEVMTFNDVQFSASRLDPPASAPRKNKAREYLESLLMDRTKKSGSKPDDASTTQTGKATSTSDWRRYEIVPGVELHISRRFRAPKDDSFRQRILVLIDGILGSRESNT